MNPTFLSDLAAASPPFRCAALAFALAATLTPLVILFARSHGLLAAPRADRWHQTPTALFGGVAIFGAVVLAGIALLPMTHVNLAILLGAAAVFGVGLVDDMLHIKPSSKLLGQIAAACVACLGGVRVGAIHQPFLAIPATIFWIVAITNAFNLLDNMDGLSAGVATISGFFIVVFAHLQGNPDVTQLAALLGGAAAGFLLWNFNPAKIFMGDCGSQVLGYVLASAALVGTWHEASNLVLVLVAPAMLLAVPIFDTTLVTVLRTMAGRPVSQGGRDHSSHRLVALGLSERRAVVVLYAVCGTFGTVALAGLIYNLFAATVGGLLLLVGIFFFGVFLGQVPVYGPPTAVVGNNRPVLLNTILLHKRRIAEVAVDFVLVCASYAAAYVLRYEGAIPDADLQRIALTLPILVVIKLSAFFVFGVYRGVWKYVGIRDALNLAKAVASGSLATVLALVLAFRFDGMSRSVFVLDGMLLLFFATGSRVLLRVFREMLAPAAGGGRRVLVIGAGDGGEMLLREIRNNPSLGMTPAGLVDDDREKQGRMVHGVPVEGTSAELLDIVNRTQADEIVIAIPSATGAVLARIATACAATGLPYRTTRRITELVDGRVSAEGLRELEILDVLPRRVARIDDARVRAAVRGKSIAVVGAGGTLGAAVAMRAAAFEPARLLLIDRDDNALVRTRDAMLDLPFPVQIALLDVEEATRLGLALQAFRPEVVIHAASLTQLSMLEENPVAAVRVNVLGTRNILSASIASGAKTLVLASAIKAANTATVLGATRRLAEMEVLAAPPSVEARVVRLGNVLGSRGGFLGRFREQAMAGGPISLTHPDAARYVLSAEEAASALLLAAGPLGSGALPVGAVLVPEHGEQVRVAEIAQAVIRWAGARMAGRGGAIEIKVIGLRPGEVLRDPELPSEKQIAISGLEAILPGPSVPAEGLADLVGSLEVAVRSGDDTAVRSLLARVPGFPEPGGRDNVIELRRK